MKKKISKILFVCLSFVFIFSFTVLPSFAYTSVNGWYDFSPNMPDMQLFYKRYGISGNTYPRTLTGYVSYTTATISSQSDNGNSMRTFKSADSLGYSFHTVYASELFLNFNYLPFSSVADSSAGTFSVNLYLAFSTNANDSSPDNTLSVRVGYYNDSNSISSKLFSYDFENHSILNLNLYNILNDSTVHGLAFIQIGYDFAGEQYASEKSFDGTITISRYEDWVALDPFVNSSQNLYDFAYHKGYLKAVEELSGSTSEEAYVQGYENGYNAGRLDGYNEGFNQATNDNANVNYQNGYQAGYSAGYNAYALTISERLAEKYQEGYNAGLSVGEEEGYNLGYSAGYDSGYDSGMSDSELIYNETIYNEGYQAGLEVNTEQSFTEGYVQGYSEGNTDGYYDGYDAGVSESIEERGLFKFLVDSIGAFFNIPLGEHFTLGGVLAIILSVPILILILKLFNGG